MIKQMAPGGPGGAVPSLLAGPPKLSVCAEMSGVLKAQQGPPSALLVATQLFGSPLADATGPRGKQAAPRDNICSRVRCDCGHRNLGEPCKTCCRSTTQGGTGNETTSLAKAAVPRDDICSRVRCDCGHPNLGEPCKTCCRSTTQGDTGNEKLPEIVAASTKAGPETAAKTVARCACLTPGSPCPVGFWCGSCTACSCPDSNCLPWSQHTCYLKPYAASAANASVVLV
jgi:hypothetical protein